MSIERQRPVRRARAASGKVPRTYRLTPATLSAAQRALGTRTATETIELALDLVLFRRELVRGTAAMLGVAIESPDASR
jgi:hypothetical protein